MSNPTLPTSSMSMPALSPDGAPVPAAWIEHLFARLGAIVGSSQMAGVYANADPLLVKAEWAEALGGFSADEVKRGLAATRMRRFAPNLPDFLHLCRPALDPEVAWNEAAEGMRAHERHELFAWSHPAVYWAARQIAFELRSGSFAQHRKRWEPLLAAEWAKGAWAAPPDPRQRAIEHQAQGSFNPEFAVQARQKLADLRRRMTGYATKAEQDEAFARAEEQALGGDPIANSEPQHASEVQP